MALEKVQGKIKDVGGVRHQDKENQVKGSKADMDALTVAANRIKRKSFQHWLRVRNELSEEERKEVGKQLVELHQLIDEFLMRIAQEE